jgi:hypothetical protein
MRGWQGDDFLKNGVPRALLALTIALAPLLAHPQSPEHSAQLAQVASQCVDFERKPNESIVQQSERLLNRLRFAPNKNNAAGPSAPADKSPCWSNPQFLAELGHLLIKQKLYLDASEYLEASILLDPSNQNAQVDYALALSGSGDLRSGSSMLSALIKQPWLPAELAPSLGLAKDILNQGVWRERGLAGLTIGYDSNLLGAPNISGLALTVSGQTAVLPLSGSYLAKKGGYGQADVQYEAQKMDLEGRRYDFYGSVRQRIAPGYSDANFTQLNLVGEYGSPRSFGEIYLNYGLSGYQTYSENFYSNNTVGAGAIVPFAGSCAMRMGASAAMRRFATNTILSGNYLGGQAIFGCQSPFYWQFIANWGQDMPVDSQRPGGAQNQATLRALTVIPVPIGQVLLDGQWASYQDHQGYSPLLADGSARTMTQYSLKTEYQYPIKPDVQAALGYNWVNQLSSLPLFAFSSSGPYIALRFGW